MDGWISVVAATSQRLTN